MSQPVPNNARLALLSDRGVVSVAGPDAHAFLDNLITNDMTLLERQDAIHAGLLTPQGKILFTFFVVKTPAGYLLETSLDKTAELVKRLTLYKLRAKLDIKDAAGDVVVAISLGDVRVRPPGAIVFVDPRDERLGDRLLIPAPLVGDAVTKMAAQRMPPEAVTAHRIGVGVPEAGPDFALGDTFPHEANMDLCHGVSFTKGCFVGQEVVARMQNKTVVRKRVVRVSGAATLTHGAAIEVGTVEIGRIGSVAGSQALAMLRLDRAAEALAKGGAITSCGVGLTIDAAAIERYRTAVADKATSA